MSGHSKWATTKHKKAIVDAKRGKILTKHSKILMVAGRNDQNQETNSTLRSAIANAKADSVPNENIERILKKLAGEKDGAHFVEQVYEGFGPEGIPFIVTALTDNANRTFPALRTAFAKHGGTLGSSGSALFLFDHVGIITIKNKGKKEDELFEISIDAGADDFHFGEEESEIVTSFSQLGKVRDSFLAKGIQAVKSEPQYRCKDPRIIEGELLEKIEKFIEAVEDSEDIDEVFGGFDVG